MTDKPKLQTYNFLTENKSIEDILNQPNTTLKNKKGVFKKRHGGLTVKISNDVLTTNEPINKESSTALNNQSSQTQIVSTEVATQTEKIYDKKSTDNFTKYSYNSLTILEDEKIRELRKKIFLLEENLENNLKQEKNLEKEIKKNNDEYKLRDEELDQFEDELIDIETEKNNQDSNHDYWNKLYFHKEKIEDKKMKWQKYKREIKIYEKKLKVIL